MNGLLSWAQHETELLQKGLLCCMWDLSDSSRCFQGGRGGQCPWSTIWSTVSLWGQSTGSAAAVVAGFGWMNWQQCWGGLAARGVQVCRVKGGRAAVLLWAAQIFLWSMVGINENVVKTLTLYLHQTLPQLKIQQYLVPMSHFLLGHF